MKLVKKNQLSVPNSEVRISVLWAGPWCPASHGPVSSGPGSLRPVACIQHMGRTHSRCPVQAAWASKPLTNSQEAWVLNHSRSEALQCSRRRWYPWKIPEKKRKESQLSKLVGFWYPSTSFLYQKRNLNKQKNPPQNALQLHFCWGSHAQLLLQGLC